MTRERNGKSLCPICLGSKQPGEALFSVDLGFGVVVVRHVPATVCDQCGAEWFSDEVAARLENGGLAGRCLLFFY